MDNPIVTHNNKITQPDQCSPIKLFDVLKTIKRNDQYNIEKLRDEQDKQKQDKMKRNLPSIIFGGDFSKRSKDGLKQASGLVCLDFDCETKKERKDIRDLIHGDKYILSYFTSTRGLGWKAIIQIPEVQNDSEYKQYWRAIKKRYPGIDEGCKDISRACFYSYDPDLVYNKKAKIFSKTDSESLKNTYQTIKTAEHTNYSKLNDALNVIRNASKGERHNNILKASRLVGGWIANRQIDRQEGERLLISEANKKNPTETHVNENTVRDGIEDGLNNPLSDHEKESILNINQLKDRFDKVIWSISDIENDLMDLYESGRPEGYYTGYQEIDELYSMHLGYTNYIYGPPFSGKSQLWFDILKNMAYRYDMKHVIYSPETGTPVDITQKLIEMVAGKDFFDEHNNRMNRDELIEAKQFIDEHFLIIDSGLESMTIEEVMTACQLVERVQDIKIHTLTIDPWNELIHDMNQFSGRQDMYLEKKLAKVRKIASHNDWHITIITHVSTQEMNRKVESGVSYYPPATFYDVSGGQAWSRRGFMMASVWRPSNALAQVSQKYEENDVYWLQQKYKPEWTGERGEAILKYDAKKHCYYTGTGPLKKYAKLNENEQTKQTYSDEAPF